MSDKKLKSLLQDAYEYKKELAEAKGFSSIGIAEVFAEDEGRYGGKGDPAAKTELAECGIMDYWKKR